MSTIKLYLLDHTGGKLFKSSGTKIEFSLSDEMTFSKKLSLKTRKTLMQRLFKAEEQAYQHELNKMGRLYWQDIVCEDVRECVQKQRHPIPALVNDAQTSHCARLFKVFSD